MLFNWLKRKTYHHLNLVSISKKALLYNHNSLQTLHPEASVCPVLKSNAYGHGLKELAPIFDEMDCPYLVVDSLYEAYELYKQKVKTPILIMGYTNPLNFTVKKLPFSVAVFDIETAKILNKYQPGCEVHLFIDTGMCREGVGLKELPHFLKQILELKNLKLVGLCSHFADSDNPRNQKQTKIQITNFREALKILKNKGVVPKWTHISASAGAYKSFENDFNMLRVGLAHYGINPLGNKDKFIDKVKLKPVLEFSSTLVQIKTLPKRSLVGYNGTFNTKRETLLGLIPAGYFDGVERGLSNKGVVKIRGCFYPIIGKVSMNMTVVDITYLKKPRIGEKVVIYSAQNADINSVTFAAKTAGVIPYELFVHLAESIHRKVVD